MSASSKKKLRNEQAAEKMTQRQQAEQKEAKKLKIYTIVFGIVVAAMLVFAVGTIAYRSVVNSGVMERSTAAATVGSHELSSAELSYYYVDAINTFYSNYSSYISYFLDTTVPLDEQVYNAETGETWADYFASTAVSNAASVYALADEASANGFTLSEDLVAEIDSSMENLAMYATYYGYSDTASYLKAMYGNGANEKSYRSYVELSYLADAYYDSYADSLTYTNDDLRAAEADNYAQYSSFSFNTYYISASKFLEGGTTDEEGNITYSDEETAASVTAAELAAASLTMDEITTLEEFDAAINGLSINAESETAVSSTAYEDYAYSRISSTYLEWVTDESRVAGDKTYIPYTTHTHAEGETHSDDEDTSAYDTVNGYYVIYYLGSNDNNFALANVRHILVQPEGGTYNSTTGLYDYTDEEKAAALEQAEALLAEWKAGDATEKSFAELANEHSADGDGTTGGLYTDVYPGQMVTNFNDWCFAEERATGDTDIVESEYGYHIMYYTGDSATLYRDYLIENDLLSTELNNWYADLTGAVETNLESTKYLNTDLVLSAS